MKYSESCQSFRKIIIALNYFHKTLHLKSLRVFWIYVGFYICQGSRVLIFQCYTGFIYFCKYGRVLNIRQMQLWKGSKYFRIPNMPGFYMCKLYTRFRTFLNMDEKCMNKLFWLWQSSEYVTSKFYGVLNMPRILNMPQV